MSKKHLPVRGEGVYTPVLYKLAVTYKQAFRFYGNEIFDHGYCEPIWVGVKVYTVQLATLFRGKTVELEDNTGKRKFCFGQKQAIHYRAGFDKGRQWIKSQLSTENLTNLKGGPVAYCHHLAYHLPTRFDEPGTRGQGVYRVRLLDVPIDKWSLYWCGYYSAIASGVIDLVNMHTHLFHELEGCDRLDNTETATKKEMTHWVKMGSLPELPICQRRTYVIEKQPKIPIDMTDIEHITTRMISNLQTTHKQLPKLLRELGGKSMRMPDKPGKHYKFQRVKHAYMIARIDGQNLSLILVRGDDHSFLWQGQDPSRMFQMVVELTNKQNIMLPTT